MERIIRNGVTIIKTGDPNGGVKNKHNQIGVSQYFAENGKVQYKAEIQVKRKKHYLGIRDTVEEAAALRLEAEKHLAAGDFEKWINHIKKPICKNRYKKKGISRCNTPGGIMYRAEIKFNGKRHYIAKRKDLQDAYAILEEAEKQVEQGTFEEWLQELKRKYKSE